MNDKQCVCAIFWKVVFCCKAPLTSVCSDKARRWSIFNMGSIRWKSLDVFCLAIGIRRASHQTPEIVWKHYKTKHIPSKRKKGLFSEHVIKISFLDPKNFGNGIRYSNQAKCTILKLSIISHLIGIIANVYMPLANFWRIYFGKVLLDFRMASFGRRWPNMFHLRFVLVCLLLTCL